MTGSSRLCLTSCHDQHGWFRPKSAQSVAACVLNRTALARAERAMQVQTWRIRTQHELSDKVRCVCIADVAFNCLQVDVAAVLPQSFAS